MLIKKIVLGSISGLCLLGTLSSCGDNQDTSAATNSADVIDDKVKVTITFEDIITFRRNSNEYEIVLKFKESEKMNLRLK